MGHDTLANHIMTNFSLIQHHHWSLTEIENMTPWEKYTYVDLLNDYLRQEEDRSRQRENERKNMMSHLNRRRM